MAAPTADDIEWLVGTDGTPDNDEDPIIGAIDSAEFDPEDPNQIIAPGEADTIGGDARTHYGGGYIKVNEGNGGSLQSAYLWLANGGLAIPAAGSISVTDPSGANTGLGLLITGIVDGVPRTVELEVDGTVATELIFDTGSRWWIEADGPIGGINGSDDLIVTVGGTQVALMRAPHATLWPNGLTVVSSVYKIAVTNEPDETLGAADRLTMPEASSGLTALSSGAWVAGTDGRQLLGAIADGESRGFVLQRFIHPGMPVPVGGIPHKFVLSGLASA